MWTNICSNARQLPPCPLCNRACAKLCNWIPFRPSTLLKNSLSTLIRWLSVWSLDVVWGPISLTRGHTEIRLKLIHVGAFTGRFRLIHFLIPTRLRRATAFDLAAAPSWTLPSKHPLLCACWHLAHTCIITPSQALLLSWLG